MLIFNANQSSVQGGRTPCEQQTQRALRVVNKAGIRARGLILQSCRGHSFPGQGRTARAHATGCALLPPRLLNRPCFCWQRPSPESCEAWGCSSSRGRPGHAGSGGRLRLYLKESFRRASRASWGARGRQFGRSPCPVGPRDGERALLAGDVVLLS